MKLQVILVSGAVSFAVAGQAGAQSASEWTFEVTPYAWMTGLKGELGTFPGVPPVDVDLSFGDVLDNLDLGGMLIATASNGPWTIYLDMTIAQLSAEEALGGVLFNRANIESETRMLALAVGRRVLEIRNGSLDAYLGARAWWLKNSFALTGAGGGVTNRTEKADWVDPLIGLTREQRLSDRWAHFGTVNIVVLVSAPTASGQRWLVPATVSRKPFPPVSGGGFWMWTMTRAACCLMLGNPALFWASASNSEPRNRQV